MPEFRSTGPALEEVLEKTADHHVIDSVRTILKQHDEEMALMKEVVRKASEDSMALRPRGSWETELEEEEARLVAEAEAKTREKLQNLMDWFRWEFERWGTGETTESDGAEPTL